MRKIRDAHLCFAGGDLLVTLFTLLWGGEVSHFFLKALGTLILGVIGGLAGLAGKDLYPVAKKWFLKTFKKLKSKLFKNRKHEKFLAKDQ